MACITSSCTSRWRPCWPSAASAPRERWSRRAPISPWLRPRTAEYEARLREARLAIFKALDQRRKQAIDARAAAVAQARERAQQLIAQAKAELEAECAAARATLEADSDRIANQIIGTLLQTAGAGPAAVLGGR